MKQKRKFKLNRKLFTIHGYTGLFIGIFYLIIAISGASIVFMEELNNLIYGDDITIQVPAQGKTLSYDELVAILQKQHPVASFISISKDVEHPEHAWAAYTGIPEKTGWFGNSFAYLDYIDPYTGKIIFSGNTNGYHNILAFLDTMHTTLWLGSAGVFTVGIVCVAILISLITGFIIYRKSILKVITFKTRIKFKNWRTANSDLHRVIGTWALLINLFIFGTGMYMFYPVFTPQWWSDTNKIVNEKPQIFKQALTISLDSMYKKSTALVPEMQTTGLSISYDTSRSVFVFGTVGKLILNEDNFASINYSWDGSVKEKTYKTWNEMSGKEKFDNSYFTMMHTGWAYGTTGKIIWTIGGFTPAILSLTGFMLWIRRKKLFKKKQITQTIQI